MNTNNLRSLALLPMFAFAVTTARAQPLYPYPFPSREQVGAVSFNTDKLAIFPSDIAGYVWQDKWDPFSGWQGFSAIHNFQLAGYSGTPVTAISRSVDKIDLFAVGTDHRVWTAAWDAGSGTWQGPWPIGNLQVPYGSSVTAVSRSTDKLDIFVVAQDGQVWTAAWQPGFTSWHGWWALPTIAGKPSSLYVQPGTTVAAVSRITDALDIFVVDDSGNIMAAAWEAGFSSWTSWRPIPNIQSVAGGTVSAIKRNVNTVDIFVTDSAGRIQTTAVFPSFGGWHQINGGGAYPGTPITGVSRSTDKLDVYVVLSDGSVWTAAWEPDFSGWHGWYTVGLQTVSQAVTAVSRSADKLDIFGIGGDEHVWGAFWQPGNTWYVYQVPGPIQ